MTLLSAYSELYWITRLDSFITLFTVISIISGISIFVYVLAYALNAWEWDDNEKNDYKRQYSYAYKIGVPLLVTGILANVFIPSKNDYILIVAGGRTINFVNNDSSINKLPGKTTEVIYQIIDAQLKKLKEQK